MSVPVCRECAELLRVGEGNFDIYFCKIKDHEFGYDDALPKTSPRWCPMRKGAKKDD
jgi:hypothetical protein